VQISEDLKPFVRPYDAATWRSPADAMATSFYHWRAEA
jgi:cyclase